MFSKITTLVVIGFVALTAQAQDSLFSLFKQQQSPKAPVKPVIPTPVITSPS